MTDTKKEKDEVEELADSLKNKMVWQGVFTVDFTGEDFDKKIEVVSKRMIELCIKEGLSLNYNIVQSVPNGIDLV